ncbi:MAG: hypothetical protein KGL39_13890 [Patescibacteria group bacterium]|nr:hypothetical protein [Patescibacteria group bacterium]
MASGPASSSTNPGPSQVQTSNTQSPRSQGQFIQTIAVNMTPLAVAADTSAEQSFGSNGVSQATAATGIIPGDVILNVSAPSLTAGLGIGEWRVDTSTADLFYVAWQNSTAASLTPPSGYYLITVFRFNLSNGETPATFKTLPSELTLA